LPFSLADVRAAAARIAPFVHRTPVFTSRSLSAAVSRALGGLPVELHFKCEVFQRGGAFKARGAVNAVFALTDDEAARGVVTHSSGNHAAALALAAGLRTVAGGAGGGTGTVPAYIVVPRGAPACKLAATEAYGGRVTLCEPTLAAREAACEALARETGAAVVPPYDHPLVAAGQGTLALEMLEEGGGTGGGGNGGGGGGNGGGGGGNSSSFPLALDALVVPVSGGGMLSGCAVACRGLRGASVAVLGAEPRGANGVADAARCLEAGRLLTGLPKTATIADGLQACLGPRVTWPVVQALVDGVLECDEADLVEAMRLVAERMKIVVEPSGACGLAALLSPEGACGFFAAAERHPALAAAVSRARERGGEPVRLGVVLCGGNVDMAEWFEPGRWRPGAGGDVAGGRRAA